MRTNELKDQIEYVLDKYPKTRNSDIGLTATIWQVYYQDKVFQNGEGLVCVRLRDLNYLPREDAIKRIRAKIQNEEMKFLPTELAVVKKRRINEEAWRTAMGYTRFEEIIT